MSYWAVARLAPRQERVALYHLARAGFSTYLPRLREWRRSHGRRIETRPPLFPGYCFLSVELQWHAARWSIGVIGLIMEKGGTEILQCSGLLPYRACYRR